MPVDDFLSAHVGSEDLGDRHGAVLVLVVLEDGDHGPWQGETGSVQGVDELALEVGLGPVLDPGPPGLEIREVAARGCLEPRILSGRVELQVVALGAREAHVPGAEQQDPVGESEAVGKGPAKDNAEVMAKAEELAKKF